MGQQNQIVWNPYTQRYEYVGPTTAWGGNPTPQMQQTAQAAPGGMPTIDGVTWVQGEGAAKAYSVPAGKTVMLIDSESDRFYIKSAAPDGRPNPLQSFRYEKDEESTENTDFVTRKEFNELKASLTASQAPQSAEEKGDD